MRESIGRGYKRLREGEDDAIYVMKRDERGKPLKAHTGTPKGHEGESLGLAAPAPTIHIP